MSESVELQVLNKIKRSPRGMLFFVDSFAKIANIKSANNALERLVKSGEIIINLQSVITPTYNL